MPAMLDAIQKRHTAFQFSDKVPSDAKITDILEAGRWAPSAGNLQPWYFVVIKDRQRIANMMRACNYSRAQDTPAVIIAVVLNEDIWVESRRRGPSGGKLGTAESLLCTGTAVMAMVLEAHSLGIQSYILTPEEDKAAALLDLRRSDFCPVIIGLGYEPKNAKKARRTRKSLRSLTFAEKFGKRYF